MVEEFVKTGKFLENRFEWGFDLFIEIRILVYILEPWVVEDLLLIGFGSEASFRVDVETFRDEIFDLVAHFDFLFGVVRVLDALFYSFNLFRKVDLTFYFHRF